MALERQVPPAGEEIHIPGPSAQPLLLTIGITIALLGVTLGPLIWVPGVILTVVVLVAWIRDARDEFAHLPAEHHVPVADTVPTPANRPHAGGPAEPGAVGDEQGTAEPETGAGAVRAPH